MKQTNFLTRMLLLFALIVGSTSVWAEDTTISVNMKNYVSDNNYTISSGPNVKNYTSLKLDDVITLSVNEGGNNGSFWGSSTVDWRLYHGQNAVVTLTAKSGYELKSATFTFTVSNSGKLTGPNTSTSTITSGTAVNLTGSSATFTVGNTNTATNGQVRMTAVSVTYDISTPVPSATLSETSLDFGQVNIGTTKNMTFTITPSNLESELTISCDNSKYDVTPTTLASNVTTATTITVTAKPTAETDNMNGTLTISGGGLESAQSVTLKASPYDPTNVNEFTKVTDANTLRAGDQLLIVCGSCNLALSTIASTGKYYNGEEITFSEGVLINPTGVAVLKLGGEEGAWTIQSSLSNAYLSLTGSSNELKAAESVSEKDTECWVISIDSNGDAFIQNKAYPSASGSNRYIKWNDSSSGKRFACYTSAQTSIQLYRLSKSVTITDAEYATYCGSKALNFDGVGITVFTATDNETSVKLNEITSGKVPANTPVVLYKEGADGTAISVPVIASADAPEGTNDLHVVGAGGLTGEDNIFVLAKNPTVGFYLWDKTKTLNEGKIYLQGKASYSSSRQFLGFEENTTGIGATLMNSERVNNGVYNLAGQRVAQPTKGLYIVNGKKVAIK